MAVTSLVSRALRHPATKLRFSAPLIYTATRGAAWNRDWAPGPYPKTETERLAAAKKYGLRPEDYEPHDPNTEPGYGDYPKMKWVGGESRDPYEFYEYPHMNSHYGEVQHIHVDASTPDRYDPLWESKAYYSQRQMIGSFLAVWVGFYILHCICDTYNIKTHLPAMPKQYPDHLWVARGKDPATQPAVVHYTFEPASES